MSERSIRYTRRLIMAATLAGLACGLGGCAAGGANTFDPTDWLDFLDQKKPLKGNRKMVFPSGVPGVEQGIPKELYKGYQEQDQQSDAAPPPAPEPEPKPTHHRRPAAEAPPKRHVAKRKPTPPAEATQTPQPAAAAPQAAPQASAPVAQQPVQQNAPAFPAPLPSGGFSQQ